MKRSANQPHIIVVGSSSLDLVIDTVEIPQENQVVVAQNTEHFFGGKGANQAVAVSRLDAQVHLISSVGMDPFGQQILRHLVDEGVNVGFVCESENEPTGSAYVISAEGKNTIVVVPSANNELKNKHIDEAEKLFPTTDILLIQLEAPLETVRYALQKAKKYQIKTILYAAPAVKLPDDVIKNSDYIVAKQADLSILFQENNNSILFKNLKEKLIIRASNSVITYFDGQDIQEIRPTHPESKHEIGMGDAFSAGFSIALYHGNPMLEALKFGQNVAYEVSKKRGSQTSLPYWENVDK